MDKDFDKSIVSCEDFVKFLRKHPNKWFTTTELCEKLKRCRDGINQISIKAWRRERKFGEFRLERKTKARFNEEPQFNERDVMYRFNTKGIVKDLEN